MRRRTLLKARHVLPISGPAILDGGVLVEDDLIGAVGPVASLDAGGAEIVDLGDAALMPGFVNVHSHLEYTLMRGFSDELPLFPWVRKLTALKHARLDTDDYRFSSLLGAAELLRAGVTCTADCSDAGVPVMEALAASGLRGRVHQEVFGFEERQCAESLELLAPKLDRLAALSVPGRTSPGISPHAPYTVSAALFRATAELSRRHGMPLAIHIAESEDEVRFIRDGAGPIAELCAQRGLAWHATGVGPVEYLEGLGLLELGTSLELIHCVQASSRDLELLAEHGVGLAHCPRSNAKLANGLLDLGDDGLSNVAGHGGPCGRPCPPHGLGSPYGPDCLRVGIGTDSAASNNTLSMLEELRFAALAQRAVRRSVDSVTPARLLEMATLGGARCLGLERSIGSIEPGKLADLCAFSLSAPEQAPCLDPAATLVFGPPAGPATLTMVAGRILCRDGAVATIDVPAAVAEVRVRALKLL